MWPGVLPASASPPGGSMQLHLDPLHILGHSGVDAIHSLAAAVFWPAPRHQPEHCPPLAAPVLHDKCSPTVPQAGVLPPLEEAGTEHFVCDVVGDRAWGVARLALVLRHHGQLHILQEVRGQPKVRNQSGRGAWWRGGRGGRDVQVGDSPTSNYTQWVRGRRGGVFLERDREVKGQKHVDMKHWRKLLPSRVRGRQHDIREPEGMKVSCPAASLQQCQLVTTVQDTPPRTRTTAAHWRPTLLSVTPSFCSECPPFQKSKDSVDSVEKTLSSLCRKSQHVLHLRTQQSSSCGSGICSVESSVLVVVTVHWEKCLWYLAVRWRQADRLDELSELHPLRQPQQGNVVVVVVRLKVWMEEDLLYWTVGGNTLISGIMEPQEHLQNSHWLHWWNPSYLIDQSYWFRLRPWRVRGPLGPRWCPSSGTSGRGQPWGPRTRTAVPRNQTSGPLVPGTDPPHWAGPAMGTGLALHCDHPQSSSPEGGEGGKDGRRLETDTTLNPQLTRT